MVYTNRTRTDYDIDRTDVFIFDMQKKRNKEIQGFFCGYISQKIFCVFCCSLYDINSDICIQFFCRRVNIPESLYEC